MQGASSESKKAPGLEGKCSVDALELPWRPGDNALGRAEPVFAALRFRRGI